jgi:hypothetical protein
MMGGEEGKTYNSNISEQSEMASGREEFVGPQVGATNGRGGGEAIRSAVGPFPSRQKVFFFRQH